MKRTEYLREELQKNVFDTLQKTNECIDTEPNSLNSAPIEDKKETISVNEFMDTEPNSLNSAPIEDKKETISVNESKVVEIFLGFVVALCYLILFLALFLAIVFE